MSGFCRACARRPYLVGLAVFVVSWAILCLPWLSGAVTIPYDAKAHFQAQIQFLANAINSGQSPFWNPDAFAGQPHIADPQSLIFSPAILLALISSAPSFQLVDAFVFALLGMGGVAALLLFREMRWPVAGAIVAAIAFSFGASAALRVQHIGQVESLAFLMVSQWLLVRVQKRAGWKSGVALGITAALMIVKPDQVALLGAYMLALHAVWHVATAPSTALELRRLAFPMLLAALVFLLIVSVPLLLTYLFVETTTRAIIPFKEAIRGSLHPASLLTAFVADLFGAVDPRIEYWGPFSEGWGDTDRSLSQNMGQIYIGALPAFAILIAGIFGGRAWDRDVRVYTVVAACMLIYGLGGHTPLFRIAYTIVPGVSGFRRPADATFLLGAYAAVLGGYLVNQALSRVERPVRVGSGTGILALAVFVLIFATGLGLAWSAGKAGDAIPKLAAALLWCSAAFATAFLIRKRGLAASGVGVIALAALMAADLSANNGPNESTASPPAQFDVLRKDSGNTTICEVKRMLSMTEAPQRRDRVEMVGLGFHWPNAGLVHRIENILGYNPLRSDLYSLATGARDQSAGWDQRNFSPLFPSYRSLLADMLGMRLIVTGVPIEQIDGKLRPGDLHLVSRTADAFIYENPRALPRAMFVANWQGADFEQLLKKGDWPKFDPRTTVLLDSDPNPVAPPPDRPGASHVQIVSYENTRIEIEVDAAQAGFIVLNDIWHAWWTASLNDAPVGILRANVLFRAIQVKAGRHKIIFEFSPVSGAFAELRERLFDGGE